MVFRQIFRGCLWAVAVILAGRAAARPVIHEIHYDPPEKTERLEFVELFNPGTEAVSLGGWRFSRGVRFEFPEGAVLGAGGYGVVAEDPEALKVRFGVDAWGPWTGRLSNEGERLELQDAAGEVVDAVEYGRGFPWPTVGDAAGLSIELIRPDLDNTVPGHWRASVAGGGTTERTTWVEPGGVWRYWPGRSAPSVPAPAWRAPEYDDGSWETGPLPIGYDPAITMGTRLDDMRGQYTSVYLRRSFTVAEPGGVGRIEVEALYDDGFRMWINGVRVLNVNLAEGELGHQATAGPARESAEYERFEVTLPPGVLRDGENGVAVQLHNSSLGGSSDCYFDARITGVRGPAGRGPTPGGPNAAWSEAVPPAVDEVVHRPERPRTGEAVTVSARVGDPDGVAGVTLWYQVVEPGRYIALDDPEYETGWEPVAMTDDGLGGDEVGGDGVYAAVVPASVQGHRRLVRYRIEATDAGGATVRVPYPDDPQPNFAYFVYDGVPAWRGAIRPGVAGELGREFTVEAEEMNRLPVLHLLARRSAVEDATWFSRYGGDAYRWRGTLVFGGRVYDHIRYRARGGVWRYAMAKNMWKFAFHRGHDFQAVDNWGRLVATPWRRLNLGASIQQGDYLHRGEQGMFESVGFRIFQMAGVPAMHTTFAQFRVIDAEEEAPENDPYEGDFWGVYLMVEQPDGRFLDEHGLPDGNLYKMEGGGGDLNNLGRAGPADGSDLAGFLRDYNNGDEAWWRTRFEVAEYLSYQTVVQAIHHYDICYDKNFFYYRNPETERWRVIPWDLDLTWADNMYDAGCGGVDRIKQRLLPGSQRFPGVWREWQNRIREFRDLFWNEDEAWRLIEEYAGRLRGPAEGPTVLDADRAQWDYNPKMVDGRYSTSPQSKAGWGRYYRWPAYSEDEVPRDFTGCVRLMQRYVTFRSGNPSARARALDLLAADDAIPSRPAIEYDGEAGYPVDRLRFRVRGEEGSGLGGAGMRAVRWRVGEVTSGTGPSWSAAEPWRYELEAVWESGARAPGETTMEVTRDALREGREYRARAQWEDVEGRTSHWSEPVQFVAGAAVGTVTGSEGLRLTELMYNAPAGPEFDFIELHNAGTTPVALGGAAFTTGVRYTFPAGTTLSPGGYLLVTGSNPAGGFAAFRAEYGLGAGVAVYGPYDGNLANSGEQVVLSGAGGAGVLFDFTYSDGRRWPLQADGAGHSLVPLGDAGRPSGTHLNYAFNWRASTHRWGSPGRADPEPAFPVVLNEVVAHTDFVGEIDSNDWVEIHNRSDAPFTFGSGWYLSDTAGDLRRWRIPEGHQIPPRGFIVFDQVTGFNNPPGSGFGLNKGGEQVFLSHLPDGEPGGVVDAVRFEGQENDWSWARVPDGGAHWDGVFPRTPGGSNARAPVRVHISEFLYHEGGLPAGPVPSELVEYVEVYNPGGEAVALSNTNGMWRLSGGIRFEFPAFTVLGPGERLVVVGFDPVAQPAVAAGFRQMFAVPAAVRLMGPFEGRLSNSNDRFALERPQAPDVPEDPISWVIVDEVLYFDRAPWPREADGEGMSLHRRDGRGPGTDPAQWMAAAPEPGRGSPVGEIDTDGDGMPDAWELAHGLNPLDPGDGGLDADGDGMSNLAEYLAGTDPSDPESSLRIEEVERPGPGVWVLRFAGVQGRAYAVEMRSPGADGSWGVVQVVPRLGQAGWVTVTLEIPGGTSAAFVRVRLELADSGFSAGAGSD
ncbi:MAG: lamin tail domain-containing protein [Verrucomicrobiae bacterium]|nr:lamin tail domain-containing protein [Verrucomicrobiae bacterium]